jgi:hypothetical protein
MGLPVESPAPDAIEQPEAAPSVDQSEAADQQNEEQKGEPDEGPPTATPAATSVPGGRFAAAYISAARFGPMVRIEIMCTVRLLMR